MPNELLYAVKNSDYLGVVSILDQNPEKNTEVLNKEYNYSDGFVEQEVPAIPLHLAVFLSSPDLVELMLKRGADANIISEHFSLTPLYWAAKCTGFSDPNALAAKLKIINLLFYYGAKVNDNILSDCVSVSVELGYQKQKELSKNNNQILKLLTFHRKSNQFLLFVSQGSLQKVSTMLDETYFVEHPYIKNCKLVEFKLDPNYDGGVYGSAILYAAGLETSDMLNFLHKKGVSLAAVDLMGNNVFHYAARSGRVENINWLLQHLSKTLHYGFLNACNTSQKYTPLHFAAKYGHVKVVEKLLSLGIDRTIKSSNNQTAEELASSQQLSTMFKVFKQGCVPTLEWLAAKVCAKLHFSFSEDVYAPTMQNLINLAESSQTQGTKQRKRSNTI